MRRGARLDRSRTSHAQRELSAFPRQFWLLSAGILILTTGIQACFPFETSYPTQEMGISLATVGLVLGAPILATLPLHVVGGAFADRYGHKVAMLVGVVTIMILYTAFALAPSLLPIAICGGLGTLAFLGLRAHPGRLETSGLSRAASSIPAAAADP